MASLEQSRIAILATDGFEESELAQPLEALREAGAEVHIVSLKKGSIRAWDESDWGDEYPVDMTVDDVEIEAYDALVLPGGTINPDKLRRDANAVSLIRLFHDAGKPVAAICHAPWLLVEANVLSGRRATSFFSIATDVKNAGAKWVDDEVVIDGNLITSRNPGDLPAFIDAIKNAVTEGVAA